LDINQKAKSNYNSRPNRNLLRIDGFDGFDIGDNGDFADEMQFNTDINLLLDKLTPKQRKVAQMLLDGYKQTEICRELSVSQQDISKIVSRLRLFFE